MNISFTLLWSGHRPWRRAISPAVPKTAELPLEKSAPVLAAHLTRVQARFSSVAFRMASSMVFVVLLVWLMVEMPMDWRYGFSRPVRAIFFMSALGVAGGLFTWFGIRRALNKPGEERTALAIERAVPEFRTRFIASVQLARELDGPSRSLIRALINHTSDFSREVSLDGVVGTVALRRWLAIVGGALVVALVMWLLGGSASMPLLQRALLGNVPVPRNTMIVSFSGDLVVAAGDDLRIEANATGVVPAAGHLRIKNAKGVRQQFTLDADPLNAAHFYRTLQSVQEGFEYAVVLGDNETETARVRVRPRPTILALECEQRWPEYTKERPQRCLPGELKLLAGSKLALKLKPSVTLSEARVLLMGAADKPPVKVSPMQAAAPTPGQIAEWSGIVDIPRDGVTGITFQLVDEEGVASKNMATYRVEIVADQLPSVRVLWPVRREELVTSRATVLIAFEAKDDFGVARVKLHFGVNWAEGQPVKVIDFDLGGTQPRSLTRRFEWKLDRIQPPLNVGDVVDYWFEVEDINNATGPGVFVTAEHYQARVVTEEDKRADLSSRLNDTLQGLNDVKAGQEDLASKLGDFIREKLGQK